MPRVKIQLADNIKRVVTFDTDATVGATLGTNLLMPNGQIGTPTSVLQWLGGALPSTPVSGSGGGGGVPIGSLLTTKGDLLTRDSQPQRLPIGTTGQALLVASGLPYWGTTPVAGGGTGHAAYNIGDMLYADAADSMETVGAGPDGWVLTMYGGFPAWAPPGSGGGVVDSVVPGTAIAVDDTDPHNPIVSLDADVSDLNDVDLAGLSDLDILIWDASTNQWVASPLPAGGVVSVVAGTGISVNSAVPAHPVVSLDADVGDLNDVDLAGLSDMDILVWDASTSQWVASPIPGIELSDLTDVDLAGLADGDVIVWDQSTLQWVATPAADIAGATSPETRGASFSGGASVIIVPTNKVPISIREDCRIAGYVVLTQGGTGSCVLNIYSSAYGGYPPSGSICASNKPTISSGVKTRDTTLTGWTTTLAAGDTLLVELESSSTFTAVSLFLALVPISYDPPSGFDVQDARDAVGGILTDSDTIDFTYNGSTIVADVKNSSTGAVQSGQYTPTGTAVANCSAVTPSPANYMRVGSVVTVSGYVTFTCTAGGATTTQVGLSLPIASNIGATYDCAGVGASEGTVNNNNETSIRGDATNNRAELVFASSATGSVTKWYTYTYRILP